MLSQQLKVGTMPPLVHYAKKIAWEGVLVGIANYILRNVGDKLYASTLLHHLTPASSDTCDACVTHTTPVLQCSPDLCILQRKAMCDSRGECHSSAGVEITLLTDKYSLPHQAPVTAPMIIYRMAKSKSVESPYTAALAPQARQARPSCENLNYSLSH